MNLLKKILLLINISILFTQEMPNNLFLSFKNEILFDCGKNWDYNSIFGPIRFQQLNKVNNLKNSMHIIDSTSHNAFIGVNINHTADVETYGFINVSLNNYYFFLSPRLVTNPEKFERYTGIPRKIKRFGFNSGETDLSGIGFQNQNVLFQISRGRESWGAGNDIKLAINQNSPAYDYFKFRYDYKKTRFVYFHGFLENIHNHNRYITGRGLEITNNKSILLGVSEIVIYSGLNRSIDIAYINPIATHLEIELNDRQNVHGTANGNAVWQISGDYLLGEKFRFSTNILIDELVLDRVELDSGKVNGAGLSTRISYNSIINNNIFIFYGSITSIGTHTFRHGIGYNNFVQRNYPLGWEHGSDGYEIKLGCNFYNNYNIIIKAESGKRFIGANSITNNYYEEFTNDYKNGPFPSGEVDKILFINSDIHWNFNSRTKISVISNYQSSKKNDIEFSIKVGLCIAFPKSSIII